MLNEVTYRNWLCHHALKVRLAPLTVIAGGNEVGKSAVLEGLRFVIANVLPRDCDGQRTALISDGERDGSVSVTAGDATITRNIADGKLTKKAPLPLPDGFSRLAMPLVMAPELIALAPVQQRRALLLEVMGVAITADTLLAELERRGHAKNLFDSNFALDRLDTWADKATAKASEARGAWKATTNETYGAVKARDWAPAPVERPTAEDIEAGQQFIASREADLAMVHKTLGALGAAQSATSRETLLQRIALGETAQAAIDDTSVAALETAVTLATAHRDDLKRRMPIGHWDCPSCGTTLMLKDAGLIEVDTSIVCPSQDELAAAERAIIDARTLDREGKERLANAKQAVAAAGIASRELAELDSADNTDGTEQKRARYTQLAAELPVTIAQARATLAEMEGRVKRADAVKELAEKAAKYHAKVEEWSAIAKKLSPDGIAADLLARAIDPFNDSLAEFSKRLGWRRVAIDQDMQITADGRPYALHSESARWRCDVVLGLAVARHGRVPLLLVDRFDVLEPAARNGALAGLYDIAKQGKDASTIVIAGTFKTKPGAPRDVNVVWLEHGLAAQAAA